MATIETIQLAKIAPIRTHTPRATSRIAEHYTVKSGDTLSAIVREHLTSTGRDASAQAVYKGVQQVAKTNRISNPDFIMAGQHIELNIPQPRSSQSFTDTLETIARNPQTSMTSLATHAGVPSSDAPFAQVLNGPATISSPFGLRKHPIHQDYRKHYGIDLMALPNTPITPIRSGTVVFSGWKSGHGNTIIVQHDNGLETQYSHAAKRLVRTGDHVSANSIVGLVGDTGQTTGPHLHMEVKANGRPVNPLPYLRSDAKETVPADGV